MIERPQRPGDLRCGERRLDEHPAGVRSTVLRDPPVRSGFATGLLHTRVQAEIGDQLLRAAEPPEVPDRRHKRQTDRRVDPRDRHQPQDLLAVQCDPPEGGIDDPQLLPVEVQLAQQSRDGVVLIGRQRLRSQPAAALDPKHVAEWTPRAIRLR